MRRLTLVLNIVFGLAWLAFALGIAVRTALLGSEEAMLAKQRGGDLRRRYDLAAQNARLRAYIAWQASPPVLGDAIRRLNLPLAERDGLAANRP